VSDFERMWRRFWFQFRLPASKVNALRVIFFGILALDLFLSLEHGPRYGAGDFNVAHFALLDAILPLPSRPVMIVLWLSGSYLALRAMLGATTVLSVRILTAIYGYTYFCSQADSYQHHYLIFLLLLISCFVPWELARASAARARADQAADDPTVDSWAMRLFVVQLALLYFWAAITKMSGHWLDGTALHGQMSVDWVRSLIEKLGEPSPGDYGGYAVMAKLLMLGELVLAACVLWRRLWPVAWVIGMSFHIGVELAGFEIGLFSYFMMGIYVLFIPDRWLSTAAGVWRSLTRGLAELTSGRARTPATATALALLALGGGVALLAPIGIEAGLVAAGVIALLGLGGFVLAWRNRAAQSRGAVAHLIACAVILCFHLTTDQVFDYYKYLGGTSRRLGDDEAMKMAYQRLTEIAPGYGPAYYHLGNLAMKEGKTGEALDLYRSAQLREPADTRPYEAEAQIRRGAGDEARALDILEVCQREIPDQGDCYATEADLHKSAGRIEQAAAAARRALAIEPRGRDATRARAILKWATDQEKK
jgi:tetratricopeptide (TPR) repeat protein